MTVGGPISRPAARVLCVDADGRVLLLRWCDPVSDSVFWEPPGGGIEDGESAQYAARRELVEETGLPGSVVTDVCTRVDRDFWWAGRRYVGVETFFLGRVVSPELGATTLTAQEEGSLLGHAWFTVGELAALDEPLEPRDLAEVLARLDHGQG